MGSEIPLLVFSLGLFFIFLLIGREVVCWYLKINERLKFSQNILNQLDDVKDELKKVNINLDILNKNKGSEK